MNFPTASNSSDDKNTLKVSGGLNQYLFRKPTYVGEHAQLAGEGVHLQDGDDSGR